MIPHFFSWANYAPPTALVEQATTQDAEHPSMTTLRPMIEKAPLGRGLVASPGLPSPTAFGLFVKFDGFGLEVGDGVWTVVSVGESQ